MKIGLKNLISEALSVLTESFRKEEKPPRPASYSTLFDLVRSEYPHASLREVPLEDAKGDRKSEFYDGNSSIPLHYKCENCGYVKGPVVVDSWTYSCGLCDRVLFEEVVRLRTKSYSQG